MSSFFYTDSEDYINADAVERVESTRTKQDGYTLALFNKKGERLGQISSVRGDDLLRHINTIVPAAAGQYVVAIVQCSSAERPTADIFEAARIPVIAWRFGDGMASPILPLEEWDEAGTILIPSPDGSQFLHNDGAVYASVEEAIESLLEKAQEAWDIAQAKKDAA